VSPPRERSARAKLRLGISVLPVVLGLLDGITNALGLTAHSILVGGTGVSPGLALRVASFALVTVVFAVFVARYVDLRTGLIRAGRHLNLLDRGALATTRLGRAVRRDALADAAQASLACCCGALLPLGIAAAFPAYRWLPLVLAVGMLTLLGLVVGHRLGGNPGLWAAALAATGIILTAVGAMLNIA
jgi:hypothetical protein